METECSCPYCGEAMSLWVDADGGRCQSYVEDCAVCCRPVELRVSIDADGEAAVTVQRTDD
jgi:hypothetical protein